MRVRTLEVWSLSEKVQGIFGASAPFIAGVLGIQIYEYLTILFYGGKMSITGWPVMGLSLVYVLIMSLAGFSILMHLERKYEHGVDSASAAFLVLAFGIAVGLLLVLHRAAFVMIPV